MFGTLSLVAVSGLVTKINAAAVYAGQAKFGSNDEITLQVQTSSDTAEIRLAGPTDRWFGVGFDYNTGDTGNAMTDTYAITVDEQSSTYVATERKLGTGQAGTVINPSTFTGFNLGLDGESNLRRAQLFRPLTVDNNADVYDFSNEAGSINMIYAWGAAADADEFAAHSGDTRGKSSLTLQDTRYFGSANLVPGKSSVKVWLSGDDSEEVKIEICSNNGNWAAVGFCGDTACGMEGTYALVKQGGNTKEERILGAAGLATGAGSAVDTGGETVASDKDGLSCMTYTRECEPEFEDSDVEDGVKLPCGNALAFAGTGNFQTNLIASIGGTADWDGQPHIAAQAGIVLDMCIYVDGAVTEECNKEDLTTLSPTVATSMPTTSSPTQVTSRPTTASPTILTSMPTMSPSVSPTMATKGPSMSPTMETMGPSMAPTMMTADTPAPTQAESDSDGSAVSMSSMILFCTMILATALNL